MSRTLVAAVPRIITTLIACAFFVTSIARAQQQPSPRWPYEYKLGQFWIHADFDVATNRNLLAQIGSLKQDLKKTLEIEIHDEAIHLVLFNSQANYRAYMSKYFPEVPARRALFIKRRGPGMVFAYRSSEMHIDLRHETTHALLNASLPYVPLWLDEGLAEYFESPPSTGARHHDHEGVTRRRAFWGQVPSIEDLEAIPDLSKMGTREYQDAWSCVHFLLHDSQASRKVLLRFLSDLQAHAPPGQLSRRVASDIPAWKKRYVAHFRR